MKVSVCISVHNTAKYLPRCLDSVCAQTLDDLEIVLVNNGSTDDSEKIMHEYANSHPERDFVIVAQPDMGLAQGRQTGINNATGDYITFLDADDLVDAHAYEEMLKCAKKENVDIVEIETMRDGERLSSICTGKCDSHEVLKKYFSQDGIWSMLWLRLYKKNLFEKPVLPALYTNNEDNFALPCLLFKAQSIFFLKEPLHIYSTDNENAVMKTETFNIELAERRFESRRKALLAIPHFQDYVGEKAYEEFYNDHQVYKAKYIYAFIFEKFYGKTLTDKVNAVIKTLNFKSKKELYSFLRKWLPNSGFNTYNIFRLFGIKTAYCVSRIIN